MDTHSIFIALAAALLATTSCGGVLRDAGAVRSAVYDSRPRDDAFEMEAVVTHGLDALSDGFAVADATGAIIVSDAREAARTSVSRGDRVRISGRIDCNDAAHGYNIALAREVTVLSRGDAPPPKAVSVRDLSNPECSDRVVTFEGCVVDVFRDETDLRFAFFVIAGDDGEVVYVPVVLPTADERLYARFVDARVSVTGLCIRDRKGSTKRKLRSNMSHVSLGDVRIVRPAPDDLFDVPELEGSANDVYTPRPGASRRRRVVGRVVAVWHGDRLVLRRTSGEFTNVVLADAARVPSYGDTIEAVGLPETDVYHLNLSRARWRMSGADPPGQDKPERRAPKELVTDGRGHRQIDVKYHGRAILVSGTIAKMPSAEPGDLRITIENEGYDLPIDFSSVPEALEGLGKGCRVEIAGTCVVDISKWHPQGAFPSVEDCAIVVRTASDVSVLSRPPWWTTGRLLAVIGSLLVALAAILAWNVVLNRMVERRGHQLMREQIGRAKANLKAEERTRLAVELHDSLAQSLTGASMEIETAKVLGADAPREMMSHLDIADKTLKSCRDDLRNCLWDLRSRALEETDMNNAILRTLSPHVSKARLAVRFSVRRALLSENTAHAVLRIVRELTLNAIRHGNASVVKIAGSTEGDRLLFSVSDDGSGFDTAAAPGIPQGHFGIAGIRERVGQLGGRFELSSQPGRGTLGRVELPISHQEK